MKSIALKKQTFCLLAATMMSSLLLVKPAHAVPYASAVKNNDGTVSFVLNENADNVKVTLNDGSSTNDLGALSRGKHTFILGLATNFQIVVSETAPAGWTQTSSDFNYLNQFFLHYGVAVNSNPTNLANFGRIYISNGSNGTTSVTGKRPTGDGIYFMNADQSDVSKRGNTASTGGLNFAPTSGNLESPYRLQVGTDGNLYIADYSTNGGTIYVTDPDVNKGALVLKGIGRTANPTVHTTISGLAVKGSLEGGDLVIHAVDGNFTGAGTGAQLQWQIGAGPLPWDSAPTVLGNAGSLGVYHLIWDIDMAPDGKIFTSFYRLNGASYAMQVYDVDGTTKLWDSKLGGATENLVGIQGIKVSPDGTKVAAVRYDNTVHVIPLTNGIPDLSQTNIYPTFPTTPTSGGAKDVAWDAAGNLYVISHIREGFRVFSPGGDSVATTSGDLSGTNGSFSVSVSAAPDPYVAFQPQNQWAAQGASATFTARAGGTGPFTYEWQFNGTNITGAANTLVVTNVTAANEGAYTVTITGANGPVTSAPANLNVHTKPVILTQPQDLTIIAGSNATFGVVAVGATSFQWLFNGGNIASQTNNSTTRVNAQATAHNGYYSVILSNSFGAVTSSIATLIVVDSAPVITLQPVSATIGASSNAPAFTVTTVGSDARTYQWQFNGTNIMGATTTTYTRNNAQRETAGDYRVIVSNPFGVATSAVATLTVTDFSPPVIQSITPASPRTVPAGSNVVFAVTARGNDPRFYQWQFNSTDIAGATNSSYTLTNAQPPNSGPFTVLVTNVLDGVTNSVTAGPVDLTVTNTPIQIYSQPVSRTNGAGVDTTFTVQTWGDDPRTYQWYSNSIVVPNANSNSFTVVNPQLSASGSTFYCSASNNVSGTDYGVNSSIVILTVTNRLPTIVIQPTNQVAAVNGSATFTVVAQGQAPLSYQWKLGTNNIAGETSSALTLNNVQLSNAATNYNVVVTSSGGSTTSQSAQLAVTTVTTPGTGAGLLAEYFADQYAVVATNSNLSLTNAPTLTRVDTNIDFNFGTGSPDPSIPVDYFIARWSGQVQPLYSQIYTFYTKSDDGLRLWVDNQLVIDKWNNGGNQNYSAVVSNAFVAGQKYNVRVEYFDTIAGGEMHLLWSSDSQIKEPIVTSQLYTNSGPYIIAISPTNRVINVGDFANPAFTVYAGGTGPLTYQWRSNGTNISGANSSALALNNVQSANAGDYAVVVTGPLGAITNAFQVSLTVPAIVVPGAGTGLTGEYFSSQASASQWYTNPPTLTRLDSTIDFAWGSAYPDISISANTFVARWTGKVQPQLSQVYTFHVSSDDGARLWVDGQLIIDSWLNGGTNVARSGIMPYAFTAGQTYGIRLEVFENTGAAEAHLSWSTPNLPKQIIPASQLYPQSGPYLILAPASQTTLVGSSVTFVVYAGGTGTLGYQWKKDNSPITSATNSIFSIANAQTTDAGDYSVVVANAFGTNTTTNATLTVNIPPTITDQPDDLTVTVNSSAQFCVTATGPAPFTYQWKKGPANILDATNSCYTIGSAQTSDSGTYSVVVSNPFASVTSSNATLTVNLSTPPSFTSPVLSGSDLILNWGTTPGSTYRLQFKPDLNTTNWTDIPPDITATSSSISVTNPVTGAEKYYRIVLLP